jgi:hypothetical protein
MPNIIIRIICGSGTGSPLGGWTFASVTSIHRLLRSTRPVPVRRPQRAGIVEIFEPRIAGARVRLIGDDRTCVVHVAGPGQKEARSTDRVTRRSRRDAAADNLGDAVAGMIAERETTLTITLTYKTLIPQRLEVITGEFPPLIGVYRLQLTRRD